MHVVATAGHVDHGKSTLVRSLTGIDPDRFAEEKERGLTIDLGFAWTALPSGREMSFVDVPGHVRFIKNMLAGVGAVDACLFVVAATEGWKPQSEEHLRILELLGIEHGLIALTKAGLVDDDGLELARLDIGERVAGTFLHEAPMIAVDPVAGIGLDDLRAALDALLATTPTAVDLSRPRLWVDRSFAARGAGTVVTGTLVGGSLAVDDQVVVMPGAQPCRIRSLQTNGISLSSAGPGRRLAVNVVGIDHDEVGRGDALVRPGQWATTTTFDAELTVLPGLDHAVGRRGAYTVYVGAGAFPATLRLLGGVEKLEPGSRGAGRIHLRTPLPLLPGDRFVIRETGRVETVGGGEVLDVAPVERAATARPTRRVEDFVARRGWVDVDDLERWTGVRRPATVGHWVVADEALQSEKRSLLGRVAEAGALGLDTAVLSERERAVLDIIHDVVVDAGRALLRSADDAQLASHPYLAALEAARYAPPTPDEFGAPRAEVRELVRRGLVIERDGLYFAPSAAVDAAAVIARLLREHPEGLTASQIREAIGTSRKYLLPLLGHLDANGVTRRRGDLRIGGPRLPAV